MACFGWRTISSPACFDLGAQGLHVELETDSVQLGVALGQELEDLIMLAKHRAAIHLRQSKW